MRDYFYGWYMKCQSYTQTLAVIPAVHRNKQQRTCSIQIITKENVWKAVFSGDLFRREKKNIFIAINEQISKFAQSYPTNSKTSSSDAPFFMN